MIETVIYGKDTYTFPSLLVLGCFDAIHRGHRELLKKARLEAKINGLDLGVMLFRDGKSGDLIYTFDERLHILEQYNVKYVYLVDFNDKFKNISPQVFLDTLCDTLNVKALMSGNDYRFGAGASGKSSTLKRYAEDLENGVWYKSFKVVTDDSGEKISTSSIKKLLSEGDTETAGNLLGGAFSVTGTVSGGYGRGGSVLGFPTANISYPEGKLWPRLGVYKVLAAVDGREYRGIANLGPKPTFSDDGNTLEVYLDGLNGDMYGKEITVQFITFMRDVKKFDSPEELKKQLELDLVCLRKGKYPVAGEETAAAAGEAKAESEAVSAAGETVPVAAEAHAEPADKTPAETKPAENVCGEIPAETTEETGATESTAEEPSVETAEKPEEPAEETYVVTESVETAVEEAPVETVEEPLETYVETAEKISGETESVETAVEEAPAETVEEPVETYVESIKESVEITEGAESAEAPKNKTGKSGRQRKKKTCEPAEKPVETVEGPAEPSDGTEKESQSASEESVTSEAPIKEIPVETFEEPAEEISVETETVETAAEEAPVETVEEPAGQAEKEPEESEAVAEKVSVENTVEPVGQAEEQPEEPAEETSGESAPVETAVEEAPVETYVETIKEPVEITEGAETSEAPGNKAGKSGRQRKKKTPEPAEKPVETVEEAKEPSEGTEKESQPASEEFVTSEAPEKEIPVETTVEPAEEISVETETVETATEEVPVETIEEPAGQAEEEPAESEATAEEPSVETVEASEEPSKEISVDAASVEEAPVESIEEPVEITEGAETLEAPGNKAGKSGRQRKKKTPVPLGTPVETAVGDKSPETTETAAKGETSPDGETYELIPEETADQIPEEDLLEYIPEEYGV